MTVIRKPHWTPEEEKYLKENAGVITTEEICEKLGRPTKAVQSKARRMGLSLKGYFKKVKCYECGSKIPVPAPSNGNIRCNTCKEKHLAGYRRTYYRNDHNEKNFDGNRFKAMERDGFICRLCGSNKNLIVHHVNGKSYHNSDKPDNRLINLTTLCSSCHGLYHRAIERRKKKK